MPKFYAVRIGRTPGVYATWAECHAETRGVSKATFRAFATRHEAEAFVVGPASASGSGGAAADAVSDPTQPRTTGDAGRSNASPATPALYETTLRTPRPAPESCFLVAFDGGARGNPGPSASAGVLWAPVGWQASKADVGTAPTASSAPPRTLLAEDAAFSPRLTNNQAEYGGLIAGLRLAAAAGARDVLIEGDSLLVVNQILRVWRVLDPALQTLHATAAALLAGFRWWGLRHIPRAANHAADALANEAMDRRGGIRREAPAGGLAAVAAALAAADRGLSRAAPSVSPYFAAAASAPTASAAPVKLANHHTAPARPAAPPAPQRGAFIAAPPAHGPKPLPLAVAVVAAAGSSSKPPAQYDALPPPPRHGCGSMGALFLAAAAAAAAAPPVPAAHSAHPQSSSSLGYRPRTSPAAPAGPTYSSAGVTQAGRASAAAAATAGVAADASAVDLSGSPSPPLRASSGDDGSGGIGCASGDDLEPTDGVGMPLKRPRRR